MPEGSFPPHPLLLFVDFFDDGQSVQSEDMETT